MSQLTPVIKETSGEEGENDKVIALLTTLVKFIGAIGEALKKFGDEKERKERHLFRRLEGR